MNKLVITDLPIQNKVIVARHFLVTENREENMNEKTKTN